MHRYLKLLLPFGAIKHATSTNRTNMLHTSRGCANVAVGTALKINERVPSLQNRGPKTAHAKPSAPMLHTEGSTRKNILTSDFNHHKLGVD